SGCQSDPVTRIPACAVPRQYFLYRFRNPHSFMGNCRLFLPDCPAGMFHPSRFSETGRETGYHPCREIRLFSQHAFPVPRRARCFKTPSACGSDKHAPCRHPRHRLPVPCPHCTWALRRALRCGRECIRRFSDSRKHRYRSRCRKNEGKAYAFHHRCSRILFLSSGACIPYATVCICQISGASVLLLPMPDGLLYVFSLCNLAYPTANTGTPDRQSHVLRVYDFPVRPTLWSDDIRLPV